MDYPEDSQAEDQDSILTKSIDIHERLKASYTYASAKKALKEEISKGKYRLQELEEMLPKLLRDLGLEIQLKNKINDIFQDITGSDLGSVRGALGERLPLPPLPAFFSNAAVEPLDCIERARNQWSSQVLARVRDLSITMGLPLVRARAEAWVWALPEEVKKEETPDDAPEQVDLPQFPDNVVSIYDEAMLFNLILSLDNGNYACSTIDWCSVRLHLKTLNADQLLNEYEELDISYKQCGIDEDSAFIEERLSLGERLLDKDYVPYLVQYAKRGMPSGQRCQVYMKILDVNMTSKDLEYFDFLGEQMKWELLLDPILQMDVRDCCNDDHYFIFQEIIEKVVFFFMRDPWVEENLKSRCGTPLVLKGADRKELGCFPPAGLVPIKHFSRYVAPFAFLSDRVEEVYYVFRSFYCRYFCYLNSLTSHPKGIISLCRLFEETLQTCESDLMYYLDSLGVSPLRLAFPWITYAFVGYLEVDQVLLLWDRVLGYDSLDVIALFAAALIAYRSEQIMQLNSQEEIEDLFYDMQHVKTVPILQHILIYERQTS